MLVRTRGNGQFACLGVDKMVALRRARNPVRPVQPRVEPLRRIGRADLACQHPAHLIVIRSRIALGIEIAVLIAPVRPRAGQPMEHLTGVGFRAEGRIVGRLRAPQPLWNVRFLDAFEGARDAGFPEILLRDDVRRDLTPALGDLDILGFKNHRPVRVDDFRGTRLKRYTGVGFTGSRIGAGEFHAGRSSSSADAPGSVKISASVDAGGRDRGRRVSNRCSIKVNALELRKPGGTTYCV